MLMQVGPKTGITVRNTGRNIEVSMCKFFVLILFILGQNYFSADIISILRFNCTCNDICRNRGAEIAQY